MSGKSMESLKTFVLGLPDVQKGVACEGTAVERVTFKAGKKAFLFLGMGDAMVKLKKSLPDASKRAKKEPGRYKAGAGGWVKVMWTPESSPDLDVLKKWVEESYRLMTETK